MLNLITTYNLIQNVLIIFLTIRFGWFFFLNHLSSQSLLAVSLLLQFQKESFENILTLRFIITIFFLVLIWYYLVYTIMYQILGIFFYSQGSSLLHLNVTFIWTKIWSARSSWSMTSKLTPLVTTSSHRDIVGISFSFFLTYW